MKYEDTNKQKKQIPEQKVHSFRRKGTKVIIGTFSKDTNMHLNGTKMQPLGVRYKGHQWQLLYSFAQSI